MKTIGDEVMVVGQDVQRARRLGGRLLAAVRRAPGAAHRHPLGRDALPRRRLLRPRGEPGLARGGARARRRGARHATRWWTRCATRATSSFEDIGQVKLKGFDEPRQLCRAVAARGMSERALEAARESGLIRAGEPLLVLLSGGGDSVCLLDVAHAARRASVRAARELRAARGLRRGRGSSAAALRPARRAAHRRARRRSARATCRRWRATRATRSPSGSPTGDYAAAHTACDQAETVLYRLAVSPGSRALLGMAPRRGRLVRPLLEVTREETRDVPARARARLARGPVERGPPLRARARAPRGARRAARAVARPPSGRSPRPRASCATRPRCSTPPSPPRSRSSAAGPAVVARRAAAELPAGLRAWCCVARRARPARRRSRRREADEILALGERGHEVARPRRRPARGRRVRHAPLHARARTPSRPSRSSSPVPGRVRFGDWEVEARARRPGRRGASADLGRRR